MMTSSIIRKYDIIIVILMLWEVFIHSGLNWLKFDIFELMFNEILVMYMHNSQLVDNFSEQAVKLFL